MGALIPTPADTSICNRGTFRFSSPMLTELRGHQTRQVSGYLTSIISCIASLIGCICSQNLRRSEIRIQREAD